MLVSKTPLRISFFGGGTDYPEFFDRYSSSVISTTIDKYVYVTLDKKKIFDEKYKIFYSKFQSCNEHNEIEHPVIRETLKYLKISDPLEFHVITSLPSRSGTGSSSSFSVGLLNLLHTYLGKKVSKKDLADMAIMLEKDILNENVGIQDQIAASYGGLNNIEFSKDGYKVTPIEIDTNEFQKNFLMFFTGKVRYASQILEEQIEKTKSRENDENLFAMRDIAFEAKKLIEQENFDDFGHLLDKTWALKKTLSSKVSNSEFDSIYNTAKLNGALGGKVLGAGGGGFFLFYCPKTKQNQLRKALDSLIEIEFNFTNQGSMVEEI